ncbi:hypothetical protein EMCRGX_G018774 [Ephydatia muelleri]
MDTTTPFQKLFELREDIDRNREWNARVTKEINAALTRIFLVPFCDVADLPSTARPKYVVAVEPASTAGLEASRELLATKYQVVLKRMQLWRPQEHLWEGHSGMSGGLFAKDVAILVDKVPYLSFCYGRAAAEPATCKVTGDLKAAILRQVKEKIVEWACEAIIAKHQLLLRFTNQQIKSEFSELFFQMVMSESPVPRQFFIDVGQRHSDDVTKLVLVYEPVLGHLLQLSQALKLDSQNISLCFSVLDFFTSHEATGKALISSAFWRPASHAPGSAFESQCVLGGLLRLSSVSATLMQPSGQFYSDHDLTNMEIATQFQVVQGSIQQVVERLSQVFKNLLRLSPVTKRGVVEWLVDCFHRNSGRTKMINLLSAPSSPSLTSDGFFLNLSWVMLRLSEPLMGKALAIDPLYCVATTLQASEGDSVGPFVDFTKETRLANASEGVAKPAMASGTTFNFKNHCFFLTHRCLSLGMTQALNAFEQVLRAYSQAREQMADLPLAVNSLQIRMLTSQILGFKHTSHTITPSSSTHITHHTLSPHHPHTHHSSPHHPAHTSLITHYHPIIHTHITHHPIIQHTSLTITPSSSTHITHHTHTHPIIQHAHHSSLTITPSSSTHITHHPIIQHTHHSSPHHPAHTSLITPSSSTHITHHTLSPHHPAHITHHTLLTLTFPPPQAHATHVELLNLCLSFYTTTAQWLVQLVTPLLDSAQEVPVQLVAVPECLVENMADFAMFLRQKDTGTLENIGVHMNHLITFITVFMGNSKLISNPHVRAKLALLLSLMLPSGQGTGAQATLSGEDFFYSHDVAKGHLIEALLKVFIDIEFTGQSFQFENKFRYRIPMYDILEYLWNIPTYRPSIELLSEQAVKGYEGSEIPLFLRFINMMLNDATVQLDEGLQNLAKVKEVEDMQSSEQWPTLSNEERRAHLDRLNEASMMAKNRNFLAMRTVRALAMITMDTRRPFVVSTLVDRLASMLNYVLQHLVGPKRNELKVKDLQRYNFNPKELTRSLVCVYLNLGHEQAFCEALPRDQRSFSMDLLHQAEQVLRALHEDDMVAELRHLAQRVQKCCDAMKMEEERYEEAPEEFLDPLMSTLMSDPVVLPTSGVSMDRVNIVRHLLSDMSDPFNRQPLTPDMLVPNTDLRKKIEEWKANRK